MDRKFCVLLYSNYSQASVNLMSYIKRLPLDFPTVVGLTMVNIDNPDFKAVVQEHGIEYVPTLLVEYYDGTRQKFDRDYIYLWITRVINALRFELPQATEPQFIQEQAELLKHKERTSGENMTRTSMETASASMATGEPLKRSPITLKDKVEGTHDPLIESTSKGSIKPDITALALEMQKGREQDLAAIRPAFPAGSST